MRDCNPDSWGFLSWETILPTEMVLSPPVSLQPQPANANPASPAPIGDQIALAAPPAGPPASVVVGPVAVPVQLPDHRTHHDLRHAFSPVASVESASGEAKAGQPSAAGAAGIVPPMCPGRVRYFKI